MMCSLGKRRVWRYRQTRKTSRVRHRRTENSTQVRVVAEDGGVLALALYYISRAALCRSEALSHPSRHNGLLKPLCSVHIATSYIVKRSLATAFAWRKAIAIDRKALLHRA